MRDLSELYLRRCGPAPSDSTVHAFEGHFGVTLPLDYLRFLSRANGGEPMLDCTFHYTTSEGQFVEDADQVKEFAPLTDDPESVVGVWRNTQLLRDYLSRLGRDTQVVCIGWNDEGDSIYLDYLMELPCVRILYQDCGDITPKIGDSLEDFLESLHPRR